MRVSPVQLWASAPIFYFARWGPFRFPTSLRARGRLSATSLQPSRSFTRRLPRRSLGEGGPGSLSALRLASRRSLAAAGAPIFNLATAGCAAVATRALACGRRRSNIQLATGGGGPVALVRASVGEPASAASREGCAPTLRACAETPTLDLWRAARIDARGCSAATSPDTDGKERSGRTARARPSRPSDRRGEQGQR